MMNEQAAQERNPGSVGEVARLFLKLGTIAFGGPAAHIAMMDDEVVRRRRLAHAASDSSTCWAPRTSSPGPNSTEMAIHLGYPPRRLAGA